MEQAQAIKVVTRQASTWGLLAATAAAHTTEHLYLGIITVVLPVIASSMGFSMSQAGFLVSARSLVAGLSNIPSGFLADLVRRRSLLLGLCLILIGLSSLLMSFAPGFWPLLAFMAVGGIGAGSFHPQSLAILSSAYRERRALALGVHDSAANLGEVVAPLTIGLLLTYTDWRTTLQIWAIPGLAVGLAYASFCSEVNHAPNQEGPLKRMVWQDMVKNPAVLGMFFVSAFRSMGQSALTVFLPLYMTLHLKLSVGTMGLYISTLFFFAGIAPSFSGWISDRIGRGPLITAGSALAALSVMALPLVPSGIPLGIGCALVGTLLWALRPVIFAAAMEVAPPQLAGTLVGFLYSGNMGLSIFAPILAGLVADAYGLPSAVSFIAIFPLLACAVTLAPSLRKSVRPAA